MKGLFVAKKKPWPEILGPEPPIGAPSQSEAKPGGEGKRKSAALRAIRSPQPRPLRDSPLGDSQPDGTSERAVNLAAGPQVGRGKGVLRE